MIKTDSSMFHPAIFAFLITISLVLLAGCATPERALHSTFTPTISGRGYQYYQYMAVADATFPVDGEAAEQVRIGWLEEWLKANRLDVSRYEIVSRRPVFRRETEAGKIYDVFYEIRLPNK